MSDDLFDTPSGADGGCGLRPCRACERAHAEALVTDRQGVLDAFAERLTKIEDWLDREDEAWRYAHRGN